MRIILILGGALFGLALASGSEGLFGAVVGGFAGFALAELAATRRRVELLEEELRALRKQPASTTRSEPRHEPVSASGEPWPVTSHQGPGFVEAQPPDTAVSQDLRPASPAPARAAAGQPSSAETRDTTGAHVHDPDHVWTRDAYANQAASAGGAGPPSAPREPGIVRIVREYFTGGNTLVRVGVVILFIGVAFLLRYVAERTHVPVELRLSAVALGAIVLLVLGWRLRKRRAGYALALQGGAIGILYLTVFASLRLFHVMSPGPAFVVLVLLSAFSAALAVLQSSMAFALLAVSCGFLAPILASTGQGSHVVLFSYYLVLNLGILAIAWFKAWRPLNVVGFLFTFAIATAWGVLRYHDDLFATTEPFLIAFFLLYVGIAVLCSLRQQPVLRGYLDGTLVFGTPVVAFGLQAALVHGRPFAAAYSALAVSAMYLGLAWALHRGRRETQRLLVEAFMALGIAFLTLAVPLALDGRWSSATWALEGAALVWVGCRQGRRLARASGALLQIASGVIFLFDLDAPYGGVPVLNSACLGGLMIAAAAVYSAHMLNTVRETLRVEERAYAPVLFFWGVIWWLGTGATELMRHLPERFEMAGMLVFLSGTAVLSSEISRRLGLAMARVPTAALLPALIVIAFLAVVHRAHPATGGGWAAWPLAFAAFYFLCRRYDDDARLWPAKVVHSAAALLLIALITWEFSWQVARAVRGGGSWPAIAWALIPAVALFLLPRLTRGDTWPFAAHREIYTGIVGTVLAIYLLLWSLTANLTMRGDPSPLPYVPVLNPLDLAQAFVLLVLTRHAMLLYRQRSAVFAYVEPLHFAWVLAALMFVWLNAILLRTLHHWADIPFDFDAMFRATLVQTALTIFWTVLALAAMLAATRRGVRVVWIVGASLMAVVIAKLFLIDLSRVGTIERIVSFVGVGLLMLVVGYFSPLPPARKQPA
jgi:uncharacterized membrane protein